MSDFPIESFHLVECDDCGREWIESYDSAIGCRKCGFSYSAEEKKDFYVPKGITLMVWGEEEM